MSLKDLFGKTSAKIVSNKILQDLYKEAESQGYLEEILEDKQRFLPAVDFSSASNFARYGSAEKYYVDSIVGIYQLYPYDGSKKEKQEWRNNASQLDLYIFDNIYPKTTGFVNLDSGSISSYVFNSVNYRSSSSPQYVTVKGGPNPSLKGEFNSSNIYDVSKNRESNLGITEHGNTVEFWYKDNILTSSAFSNNVFCLFDTWNGVSSGSNNYSRLLIEHSSSNTFLLTYVSGTNGVVRYPITYNQDRNNWHHYAFTAGNNLENVNDLDVCLYIDGNLIYSDTISNAGGFSLADNAGMIANIGSYRANIDGQDESTWNGLGTSYGSFDDVRFWKAARDSKQIYRNWFTQVGGGSNTDDANTDLGIYFKFNEGLIGTSQINSLDSFVIDYSGRVSNGLITNYNLNCRNTSSAIDVYFNESVEQKDPILYSSNPLISSVIKEYRDIGTEYDRKNNANIYYSIPSWITEEAEKNESNDLSNLVQIISSYFDTLHVQIKDLPSLKNVEYVAEGVKPKPFSEKLLTSYGFENIDLFNDVTFLEDVLSRNENMEFEDKLHNIKNTIYQNIYNNLAYIYKSKGTEKSLRNLIRCFGIDDELIKINLYADNSQYELTTKYKSVSSPKKFVDFNNADRHTGYIYQKNISGDGDTRSYILGNGGGQLDYVPLTSQIEVIFPKKVSYDNPQYQIPNFTEVSIYGAHTAKTDANNVSWGNDSGNDLFNFEVYAVKRSLESPDVYFKLVTTMAGVTSSLTTSYFNDVYDNQKWNFSVRISPQKYDMAGTTSGSTSGDYLLEFIGNNSLLDNLENNFKLSLTIPEINAKSALGANKRFYVGANYTNFDPLFIQARTDVKASSLRVWLDYLTDEELLHHSYDSTNIGRQHPNWKPSYEIGTSELITKLDTLALDWDFFNVTSSDAFGEFIVQDTSSGSLSLSLDAAYPIVGNITKIRHTGYAKKFFPDDDQVVNKEYVFNAKQIFPESIAGSDLIQTPVTDDVTRTKTSKPINFYLSIEKSMSQVVNDEILNWFATIKDFNNLIGDPIEKYRAEYKNLSHLRRLFFDKVQNTPDFEKFLEFYKWIDNSISTMVSQLIPASANVNNKVRNIVESHLLERNKYQNIAPSVNFNGDIISIVGSHLDYVYEDQKAPTPTAGTLWLKQRATRTDQLINTPLEPQNDIDREIIRQVINNKHLNKVPVLYSLETGTNYEGYKDKTRIFSKLYRFNTEKLLITEDVIQPLTVANTQFVGQFKFAPETVTGSGQIVQPITKKPNFFNKYEYLQLSGRSVNNKSFVDLTGSIINTTSSLSGVVDRVLPVRNAYKNIFVERFSAPGGPEISSRGALDGESEEYSAYNDLNSRNIRVRRKLRSWLGESSSYDSQNPSLHKVNKNTGYRPLDNTGLNTKAVYDNEFVQHQIPQSDAQYAWITGSLAVKPNTSGYMTSYSNLNSYNTSSFQLLSGSISGTQIVDYVGLNTTIDRTFNTSSGITSTGSNYSGDLNKYLNNNNGPYGYPSWKQIRKNSNKIVQDSVKNNKILSQDIPIQKSKTQNGYTLYYTENKTQTFTAYKQPAVTFNKPMKHSLFVTGSEAAIETISTYDNNKERFTNTDLMRATNVFDKTDTQAHDLFAALDDGIYEPKPELYKIEYETMLYPSDTYAGLSDVRMRDSYEDFLGNTGSIVNARTFWRNEINERARESVTKDIYEYLDTSYAALPDEQPITVYNDIINNTNIITNIQENKTSILALDSDEDFTTLEEYKNFSYNNFNKFVKINSLGEIESMKTEPYNIRIFPRIGIYFHSAILPAVGNDIIFAPITVNNSSPSASYWDGVSWKPMSGSGLTFGIPSGPSGFAQMNKTFISGSNRVYAAGKIINALSGVNVSQWDGNSWAPMGGGLGTTGVGQSGVHVLISGSNRVYAGGYFNNAGSGSAVSQWDGVSWSPMSGGFGNSDTIFALASGSDRVYAGGWFNIAASGSRISQWDGITWSPMAGGLPTSGKVVGPLGVYAIVSGSNRVYAGGNFNSVDSGSCISQWDGASWSPLGQGLNAPVNSIVSNSSGLYVVGLFTVAGNKSCNGLARWDGQDWYSYSNASYGNPYTIVGDANNNLYINGNFTQVYSNNLFNKVAKYNNPSMSALGTGLSGTVYTLTSGSNGVYVGGSLLNSDIAVSGTSILAFNGTNWQAIGGGIGSGNTPEYVYAIVSGSNRVYAAGDFSANASSGSYISQWDGTTWTPLGGTVLNRIFCLLSSSEGLYAGGQFMSLGTGYFISRWNGSSWNRVGSGTGISNQPYYSVFCLISGSNFIYAGGGGGSGGALGYDPGLGDISYFSGSTWQRLSIIPKGTVTSLLSSSEGLYAGGAFRFIGSETYNYIGLWNGFSWSKLGLGVRGPVNTIVSSSDGILVGGSFTKAGGQTANYIAKWDGSSWSNVATGFDAEVKTMLSTSAGIYIGGAFQSFGDVEAKNARYERNIKGNITANDLPENVYFIKNNIDYYVDGLARYNVKEKNLYNINSNLDRLEILAAGEYIYDMVSNSSGLYAVGSFLSLETGSYDYIARRVGQTWQGIGNISNTVNTITSGSNRIYIGGDFTGSAGVRTICVAQWNGTSWLSMSSGLTSSVRTICSGSNRVYAGGTFNIASSGSRISQWDGTSWSPMSTGLDGAVNKIISGSNTVFAAGNFTGKVAQWNGSSWTLMGGGLNGEVFSLFSGSNRVYAVGNFDSVNSGSYISQWDGASWSKVGNVFGNGFNNIARDLFSNSSGLYVVGDFTLGYNGITPISLNGVAKWNGSSFEQVNNSNHRNGFDLTNGSPNRIIGDENNLLIAGTFTGIKSGPIFTPKNYNNPVEAYATEDMLMPTPQLVHLNYIQPSYGFTEGMKITEVGYNFNNELTSTVTYTGKERINILNEGYAYEIPEKSGKTPFFNSYLDYLADLKARTAKYSIIPEYAISDYIKTYVNDKNGDFNSILQQDYLKLDGAAQQSGYENINNSINITNTFKPELIFDNSKNNENVSLNFKISGIKKLMPYRDFYPSERIVKLSNYFMNSFLDLDTEFASELSPEQIYQSVLSNETPINQQILTLLQPIMAPGILLNTIKSSIAVDWPAFICNSGSYSSLTKPAFYAETGSALVSASYYVSGTYVSYTASNYIDQEQNYRFPFESLIEFDVLVPQELKKDENNLYYLNPSYYTSDVLNTDQYNKFAYPSYNMGTGSLKPFVFRNSNYKLAMHNFLAEIPNFFLNGKLSNIVSLPEKFFKAAKQGVTYYMDVVLERNDRLKEFVAIPFYEKLKLLVNSQNDGTLLLPSPDSLYGPPTRYWNNVNSSVFFDRSPYNFYSKLFDTPAYAPYVPPYYYGKAIARISFTANEDKKYSLAEIQSACTVEYINSEADALFRQRSNYVNGNFNGPYSDNYSSSPAYKQMMKLSSSINLFLASDGKTAKYDAATGRSTEVSEVDVDNQIWTIQTKFETPSINFSNADLSDNIGLKFLGGSKEGNNVSGIYSYMMKGLWTTYGTPVNDGEGIKMYVQESFSKVASTATGSLIDLCGFTNVVGQKKTVGLLAERKQISECMVIIPYTYNKNHGINTNNKYARTLPEILGENGIYFNTQAGNGPYYYAIEEQVIESYLEGLNYKRASIDQIKKVAEVSKYKNSTIIKLILAMINYVVPPHLDWLRNKNLKPFIMYIAEFGTELDKQDLSDIWQGVMPKQSYNAELEDISINHKFTVNEFFHGKRPQNDTRFKIFKIKKRANINYYKLTDDSKDDERFSFKFGNSQQATVPEYSYNWPYDFFSLVELVNIDASLSVDNFPETTEALKQKQITEIVATAANTLGPVNAEVAKEIFDKRNENKNKVEVENTRFKPFTDARTERTETPPARKTKKPRG